MRWVLVWAVRLCGLVGWVATAVACTWLLGVAPTPKPWEGPLVWGAVAVACAVARALLLWVPRVVVGVARRRRRRGGDSPGVSLSKEKQGDGGGRWDRWDDWELDWGDPHDLSFHGWEVWAKLRTGAVWLLVAFASGAFFVGILTSPDWDDRVEGLRDAGAEVSVATVMRAPEAVRADVDDEDAVQGYSSRLVVSVPGGPARLTVKGAYTEEKPREGAEVDVLWARSAQRLGGYVNETQDLPAIAERRWKAFPDGDLGSGALVAFIVLMLFGGILAPVFSLVPDADDLQEVAWSPWVQTVRAAVAAAVFLGWRPLLLGEDPHLVEALFAGGGFVLVFLAYFLGSVRSLG
ncbi:hypothetical protein ACFYRY_29530 [Streptomyces sp. NPDC005263]|uniref:hypothetical protein n=1 Tax=Streptomyces sp. NPDC005263 TaxID=3364711 RepID=UPI0036C83694